MILTAYGTTITFPRIHARPYEQAIRYSQPHDFTLGGAFYLYDRGVKIKSHRLIWTNVPLVTIDAALNLFDITVHGQMRPLTWINPLWGERDVFLTGSISVAEPLAGRYAIAMTLLEIVAPPVDGLLDASGDNLIDSSGNILWGAP